MSAVLIRSKDGYALESGYPETVHGSVKFQYPIEFRIGGQVVTDEEARNFRRRLDIFDGRYYPIPGQLVAVPDVILPDGTVRRGTLDDLGLL